MTTASTGSWIMRSKQAPRLRLFCFPYAGGGASAFRSWLSRLPATVEVCPIYLPGREHRLKEAAYTRVMLLVETLGQALKPHMDIPYAFFGHSMGALISFELARYLRKIDMGGPVHLFISAHRAPQIPDPNPPLYNMSETALINELRRLGGTPKEVLEHAELMQVILPMLRADFELCETYTYSAEPPLNCPISVLGGEQDGLVRTQELAGWKEQTRSSFSLNVLPGDHFFLHSQQALVLEIISRKLLQALQAL